MVDAGELFSAIGHATVSARVVDRIETMILEGVLPEECRLPPERELAARMGVSRPKLREALRTLSERDLVRIRHGDGTFVARLTSEALSPGLIDLYARHGLAARDYLEYRREQEGFAARLAAARATEPDHWAIAGSIEALEAAHLSGDIERSEGADVAFHTAIVNASHNSVLIHMMRSIYALTRRGVFYNRRKLRSIEGAGERLLDQHRSIATAILAGDPDAAEGAARAHLDFVEHSLSARQAYDRRSRHAAWRQGRSAEVT